MITFVQSLWASSDRLSNAITLANWGIAASLLFGFLFTAFVIIAGNRKDELNNAVAKAQDVRIAEAQKGAEEARKETARLTNENLTLQADVLKLREKMADRRLTPEQQRTIGSKLRPFAGTRINLFAMGGDSEIIGIGNDVLKALADPTLAAWMVTVGSGQDSAILSSGILLELSADATEREKQATETLIKALRSERLVISDPTPPTRGAIMGNLKRDPMAHIRIVIAKKP